MSHSPAAACCCVVLSVLTAVQPPLRFCHALCRGGGSGGHCWAAGATGYPAAGAGLVEHKLVWPRWPGSSVFQDGPNVHELCGCSEVGSPACRKLALTLAHHAHTATNHATSVVITRVRQVAGGWLAAGQEWHGDCHSTSMASPYSPYCELCCARQHYALSLSQSMLSWLDVLCIKLACIKLHRSRAPPCLWQTLRGLGFWVMQ